MLTRTTVFCGILVTFSPCFAQETAKWTKLVERHLQPFSVLETRRDPSEQIIRRGKTLQIRYRKDLRKASAEQRDQFVCNATKWLIAGRLATAGGAARLFADAPEIEQLQLVTYAVDTSVEVNRKGRYNQKRKLVPLIVLSLKRERAESIDAIKARDNLKGKSCRKVAEVLLSQLRTNNL